VKYLDLTFSDPASNLACDEALLEFCESSEGDGFLRVWEPDHHFVVVGYSNKVATEVNVTACDAKGIPILRRFSGGGTVLQGPGCLNYSLAVKNPALGVPADLTASYGFVLGRHLSCFASHSPGAVQIQGISDLAIDGRKFSGNAQHRKRGCSLFHGTILYRFDLSFIEPCLNMPSREPAYRHGRSHGAFLCNLEIAGDDIRRALRREWGAEEELREVPLNRIKALVRERYGRKEWNFKY
jgi:lipoate-protein ligase A